MNKICHECGGSFESNHFKKLTCSPSCAAALRKATKLKWVADNKERTSEYNKKTQAKRIANGKMLAYQQSRRASKAGYLDRFMERIKKECPNSDISREYLDSIFGSSCAVTGVPFQYSKRKYQYLRNPYSPSIDRIDSSKEYMRGNVQVVLTTVNLAKTDMSMKDFTEVWGSILKSWGALTQGKY